MTVPSDWDADDVGTYVSDTEVDIGQQFPVVPVKVVFDENERVSPQFASFMTWPVPQTGIAPALLVLPRKQTRYKAKWVVTFTAAGTLYLNSNVNPLNNPTPQGFAYTVAAAGIFPLPEYDSEQPVYAIATVAGVTLSIIDESYGAVATS